MDLGAKLITKLWKALQQDIWCSGDSFPTSLQNLELCINVESFSLGFVSIHTNKVSYVEFSLISLTYEA